MIKILSKNLATVSKKIFFKISATLAWYMHTFLFEREDCISIENTALQQYPCTHIHAIIHYIISLYRHTVLVYTYNQLHISV